MAYDKRRSTISLLYQNTATCDYVVLVLNFRYIITYDNTNTSVAGRESRLRRHDGKFFGVRR